MGSLRLLLMLLIFLKLSLGVEVVMENTTFGGQSWFTVYGYHISSTYNPAVYATKSFSACRIACWTTGCLSLSMVETSPGLIDCRVIWKADLKKKFVLMAFEYIPGAFFYTTESYSGYYLNNGIFYYALRPPLLGIIPTYCQNNLMDTGRNPVVKTKSQVNTIISILTLAGFNTGYSPVNLNYKSLTGWTWSDGTVYNQTELGLAYPLSAPNSWLLPNYVTFNRESSITVTPASSLMLLSKNYTLICQMNPFNVTF